MRHKEIRSRHAQLTTRPAPPPHRPITIRADMRTNVNQVGKLDGADSRPNNYHHPENYLLPDEHQQTTRPDPGSGPDSALIEETVQERGRSGDMRAHGLRRAVAVGGEDRNDDRLVLVIGVGDIAWQQRNLVE